MFSALKKLAKSNDDRCPAPVPMSSSLQKKFSRGVHYNMKILIKGDRNVGKSCLLQRLQGGAFIEDYVPTEQIQAAPIHWTYKNTDHIVKVEVWEVVDKARTKKKAPLGLKLENQNAPAAAEEVTETPVLDATFLDVYKNATGVILMMDITKPWTFEYVVKELTRVPADLPVVILGNHCDMQHHRQVHSHHIEQALHIAKLNRLGPIRYAESSMRNGFGLRQLHKFLSVPFLRLQRASLLEQLDRNQRDTEDAEKELDEYQRSEESNYEVFVDRLANKRRAGAEPPRLPAERSPSIVLGAGKPIIPPDVNPLLAQSLNPLGIKAQHARPELPQQVQYVNPELMKPKHVVSTDVTPHKMTRDSFSTPTTATAAAASTAAPAGDLDEFYAGALDTSFLDDAAPAALAAPQDLAGDTDSDEADSANPMVTIDQDDLDIDTSHLEINKKTVIEDNLRHRFEDLDVRKNIKSDREVKSILANDELLDVEFPMWAGDSSARRSPEGGEDPDNSKEALQKSEKKHKKKKSKDKDKDGSGKKEKKHKKSKEQKVNPQQALLPPTAGDLTPYDLDDYDSL